MWVFLKILEELKPLLFLCIECKSLRMGGVPRKRVLAGSLVVQWRECLREKLAGGWHRHWGVSWVSSSFVVLGRKTDWVLVVAFVLGIRHHRREKCHHHWEEDADPGRRRYPEEEPRDASALSRRGMGRGSTSFSGKS